MEKAKAWVRAEPLGWVAGVLVLGLILGGILGALIGGSGKGSLENERDELKQAVATAHGREEAAEERETEAREGLRGEREAVLAAARRRAKSVVGEAQEEAEELEGIEGEISSAEERLSSIDAELTGAEETKAKSSIPGNGTYQAEVDFIPGTYRSSGGPGCYWATLNSADPYDIASNENASGQTIADINTPYFQTDGCGRWERIGE